MTIKICMNKIIKFSLMDTENELNLISCHRCKTVSRSTNQITQGTKYIQSVREDSQPCQYIYERPRAKYHSGSLWKLWRMWTRRNNTESNEDNSQHPKPITIQTEDSCHHSTLLRRQTRMCKASTLRYHSTAVLTKSKKDLEYFQCSNKDMRKTSFLKLQET
jgi:hypothetical protein